MAKIKMITYKEMIPRRLELQTLRLLVVRSNQLSYGIIDINVLDTIYYYFIKFDPRRVPNISQRVRIGDRTNPAK